jgi:hypothetical protein
VGGRVDSPSKREKPKARKKLKKRGAYHLQLHALLVRLRGVVNIVIAIGNDIQFIKT